jgi:hypothetical protein
MVSGGWSGHEVRRTGRIIVLVAALAQTHVRHTEHSYGTRQVRLGVEWGRPVQLRDGSLQNLIYIADLNRLPKAPGVYVLARRWGTEVEALYVGKANQIRGRVKTQLNNLRLMQHMRNAKAGKRIVLTGRFVSKPGQQLGKCLLLIERALIRYFLSEGHDLVNTQGTRLRRHEVESTGKHPKKFIPKTMYVEKSKRG